MILVYNFFLTSLCCLLFPLIVLVILSRSKYRGRSLQRFGFGKPPWLKPRAALSGTSHIIWIHALSVGEVTSALPLVQAIQTTMPTIDIIFTTATRSGKKLAENIISPHVQCIYYSPFDLFFSVNRYIRAINPHLFILVETDFWPNWLWLLHKKGVPSMLVNGRISARSMGVYQRFSFFFKPVFSCFSLLSMQTENDADNIRSLGVKSDRVVSLGNLKFDMASTATSLPGPSRTELGITDDAIVWVCGSTHPREENILFATFAELRNRHDIFLLLAPRDINRADTLLKLARQHGFSALCRTDIKSPPAGNNKIVILDTIGELSTCYQFADLAFVGGSLVRQGGHNPIEPAAHGVPVLFGPHMEDFSEISQDLITAGGAKCITSDNIKETTEQILSDTTLHRVMSTEAIATVNQHRGSVTRHMKQIQQLLAQKETCH